jgi:hypothetical protein
MHALESEIQEQEFILHNIGIKACACFYFLEVDYVSVKKDSY